MRHVNSRSLRSVKHVLASCLNGKTSHYEIRTTTTVYLTHALVSLASGTDLGVGDVEVASVHLSTPLVADNGQVHRLQYILIAGAWRSVTLHFMAYYLL